MRIAINASSLLSPATGIASYTRNLAQALLESGKVEAFFFYGVAWSRGVRDVPLPAAMPVKSLVRKLVPYAYEVNRFVQQRMFNAGVARYQPDVYHDPNYLAFSFDGPVVITIHDMSHIRYPEMHPESRVNAMNKYLPPSIALAVQIIVDSEFVKSEVVNHFGVDPARVHAIHLGVAGHYTPRRAEESASALMP